MSQTPSKNTSSRMVVTSDGIKFLRSSHGNKNKIKLKKNINLKILNSKKFSGSNSPKKSVKTSFAIKKGYKTKNLLLPNSSRFKNKKMSLFAVNTIAKKFPLTDRSGSFFRKQKFSIFSPKSNWRQEKEKNPKLYHSNDQRTRLDFLHTSKQNIYNKELKAVKSIYLKKKKRKTKDYERKKFLKELASKRHVFDGYANQRMRVKKKIREKLTFRQEKIFRNIKKIVKRNKFRDDVQKCLKEREELKLEERLFFTDAKKKKVRIVTPEKNLVIDDSIFDSDGEED